jgi:hypothetical protein
MSILIIGLLLVVNIPAFKAIFRMMFTSMDDFYESLRYVFTPDILSLFRGEYIDDWYGEMKVQFFVVLCGVLIFAEYTAISKVFYVFGFHF